MNAMTDIANLTHAVLPVADLHPHPKNPRIEPRQDIVDQLAARMADGFDPAHALIVRARRDGYEIISGHHRWLAAQQAGLSEVPCWVRDLSDDDAYMQLVLCNTQSELHALEEGKHAAESGMDLKSYAEKAGKIYRTLHTKIMAFRVMSVSDIGNDVARSNWSSLAEIHAAPAWLWPALVSTMLEKAWTVAVTRDQVGMCKGIGEPPAWSNAQAIGQGIVVGTFKASEIARFASLVDSAKVSDADLCADLQAALTAARPSALSEVMSLVRTAEAAQAERDAKAREAEEAQQRALEQTQQRIVRLVQSCSLDEWKELSIEERAALLNPDPAAGGKFNAQKGASIEWAQWSWNPVTGCRHDCAYCYARDIANSARMDKAGLYPHGFEPAFRSAFLNAPRHTPVPQGAATDTRLRNVFTCSMADLFGRWVPVEWINAVMLAVRGNPQWNFLFLTKFPQRFAELEIPENAWMGTTVDMQARVKNAEKAFANLKTGVRWLSVEPMIEPIKLSRPDLFNWVVIGGASRSDSTPAWQPPYRWIESLVRQCDEAGVPVYMKANLGIANRVLALPFDAPLSLDPQEAPAALRYLPEAK